MGRKNPKKGKPKKSRRRGSRRRFFLKLMLLSAVLASAIGGVYVYLKTRTATYRVAQLQEEAQIHLRLGNVEKAIPPLEEAVALLPDVPGLAVQLSGAYEEAGRPEDAERVLRSGLERQPSDRMLSLALARHLVDRERGAEAYDVLAGVLDSIRKIPDPQERAEALTLAGRAAARAGSLDKAESLIQEAAYGENKPTALAALGDIQAQAGRLAVAEASLKEARRLAPDRSDILIDLARILDRNGKRNEAMHELSTAFRSGQDDRLLIGPFYAELLLRDGEVRKAIELADEIAKDGRGLASATQIRGMAASASGDDSAAEVEFRRLAQLQPRSALPLLYIARLAGRRGDVETQRQALEDALARQPGLPEAELGLLDLEERAGVVEAVRARAERLLAAPDTRARAIRALLSTHVDERDLSGVLERIQSLLELFPGDRGLRVHEALFRLLAGQTDAAIESLREIVEEDPDETQALALLASAHEQQSDAIEAMEFLGRLAAEDPRFASARVVLARLYRRLGRPDLARRQVDAALRDRPDHPEARWIRAQLATIAGDYHSAVSDLEAVRGLEGRQLMVLGALADLKSLLGETGQAVRLLEEARTIQPGNVVWTARLAGVLARAGEVDRALAAYAEAQRLGPTFPPAHEDGLVLLAEGRAIQAKVALARGLERTNDARFAAALAAATCLAGQPSQALEPLLVWRSRSGDRSAEGLVAQAIVLTLAGDRGRAEAVLRAPVAPEAVRRAVLALVPGPGGAPDREARLSLEIFAFRAAGWTPERLARVREVAESGDAGILSTWWALESIGRGEAPPDVRLALARRLSAAVTQEPGPGLALALAQLDAGDRDGHLQTLQQLEARFPEDPGVALLLGMALEKSGDRAGALREYTQAASVSNPSPVALNNLAYRLGEDPTRRQAAIQYARGAARLAPTNGSILDTLGWLLFRNGQVEEGIRILQQAVAASPNLPTIRYHFARALEARGNVRRAASQLEMAFLVGGEFEEADEARDLLSKLKTAPELAAPDWGSAERAVLGRPFDGRLGSDGRAVYRLEAGSGEVRLVFQAPADAPSTLTVLRGSKTLVRLEAAAGETSVVPRLETGGELGLVVRPSGAQVAKTTFRIEVGAASGEVGGVELEPNDEPSLARPLAIGDQRSGRFHGPSDVDCYRLELPEGGAGELSVEAGADADVIVEILSPMGDPAKLGRVARGRTATIPGLASRSGGELLVRLTPGESRASSGRDYLVKLVPARAEAGDREPNDRTADAIDVALGAAAKGEVGSVDLVDWYRISAPGRMLSIELHVASQVGFEIWEDGEPMVLVRRCEVGDSGLALPRWKAPSSGRLYLAVFARGDSTSTPYELILEEAVTPEGEAEVEPNDSLASADRIGGSDPFRASLDAASDVDWVRAPILASQRSVSIELTLQDRKAVAFLDLFAGDDGGPRFLGRYATAGGRLVLPHVAFPHARGAVSISPAGEAPGPYELRITPIQPSARLEAEPNDEASRACALGRFGAISGRLSGAADRDLVRVATAGAVVVRATGAGPVAVKLLGEPEPRLVEPGTETKWKAGEGAILELSIPGAPTKEALERLYELRWESEP